MVPRGRCNLRFVNSLDINAVLRIILSTNGVFIIGLVGSGWGYLFELGGLWKSGRVGRAPMGGVVRGALRGVERVISISAVVNSPVRANGAALVPISGMSCNFADNNASLPSGRGTRLFNNNNNNNVAVSPITFVIVRGRGMEVVRVGGCSSSTSHTVTVVPRLISRVSRLVGTGRRPTRTRRGTRWFCVTVMVVAYVLF